MSGRPHQHHPQLGWDRMLAAEPALCSGCCEEIPEDQVPLILWAPDGRTAWQYCALCERPILARLLARAPASPAPVLATTT